MGIDVGVGVGVKEGSIVSVTVGDNVAAPRTSFFIIAWAEIMVDVSPAVKDDAEQHVK